jgi:hypothetical protein
METCLDPKVLEEIQREHQALTDSRNQLTSKGESILDEYSKAKLKLKESSELLLDYRNKLTDRVC